MDTGKIIYYGVLGSIFAALAYFAVSFFSPESSEEIESVSTRSESFEENLSSRSNTTDRSRTRSRSSDRSQGSAGVWNNDKLLNSKFLNAAGRTIAEQIEVRGNLDELGKLLAAENLDEVKAKMQDLIEKHPDVPEYQAFSADYHFSTLNLSEAERATRKVIELAPENAVARVRMAKIMSMQGRNDEALEEYEMLYDAKPGSLAALLGMRSVYQVKQDPEGFQNFIESEHRAQPSNGNIALMYAETLPSASKRVEVMQRAASADPENVQLLQALSQEQLSSGDANAAERTAKEAMALDQNPASRRIAEKTFIDSLIARGSYDRAQSFAEDLLKDDPRHSVALTTMDRIKALKQVSAP